MGVTVDVLTVLVLIYFIYNEIKFIFLISQINKSNDLIYKTIDVVARYNAPEYIYEEEYTESE